MKVLLLVVDALVLVMTVETYISMDFGREKFHIAVISMGSSSESSSRAFVCEYQYTIF